MVMCLIDWDMPSYSWLLAEFEAPFQSVREQPPLESREGWLRLKLLKLRGCQLHLALALKMQQSQLQQLL